MAGPVSYERQSRNNELKSADALERIAIVLEKIHAHLTGAPAPAHSLPPAEPPAPTAEESEHGEE